MPAHTHTLTHTDTYTHTPPSAKIAMIYIPGVRLPDEGHPLCDLWTGYSTTGVPTPLPVTWDAYPCVCVPCAVPFFVEQTRENHQLRARENEEGMPVSAAVRETGVGTVSYTKEGMLRAWEWREKRKRPREYVGCLWKWKTRGGGSRQKAPPKDASRDAVSILQAIPSTLLLPPKYGAPIRITALAQ